MALDNVLFELRHSEPHLKHVEADDRSIPKIEPGKMKSGLRSTFHGILTNPGLCRDDGTPFR